MMSKPDFLGQLIELASKAAGSDYKLAGMLDQPRSAISMWKAGKRTCPVADVALMAHIAGLDAEAWVNRAVVAQYTGTPKGEKLAVALGKALLVTGGVLVGSGAHATELISAGLGYVIRCAKDTLQMYQIHSRRRTV